MVAFAFSVLLRCYPVICPCIVSAHCRLLLWHTGACSVTCLLCCACVSLTFSITYTWLLLYMACYVCASNASFSIAYLADFYMPSMASMPYFSALLLVSSSSVLSSAPSLSTNRPNKFCRLSVTSSSIS